MCIGGFSEAGEVEWGFRNLVSGHSMGWHCMVGYHGGSLGASYTSAACVEWLTRSQWVVEAAGKCILASLSLQHVDEINSGR